MMKFPRSFGISRQILVIFFLVIVFVTAGLSFVTGVTSFNNLATITLDELGRMSKVLSVQLQEFQKHTEKSALDLEANPLFSDRLEQLTYLGPYYFEPSQQGLEFDESDKIYALQSQLDVLQFLQSVKSIHQLSSISLYNLPTFDLMDKARPVLNLRIDESGIWVAKFNAKGNAEDRHYYKANTAQFRAPRANLFDVSSVYRLTVSDFYQRTNFNILPSESLEQLKTELANQVGVNKNQGGSKLTKTAKGPALQTWSYLKAPVSNPSTWEEEQVPVMIMVLEQTIDNAKLKAIKEQLGIDVALAQEGTLLASSLPIGESLGILQPNQMLISSTQSYYYAQQKINFSLQEESTYSAVVLSPISTLDKLTQSVFLQMRLLALMATLLAAIAIYWAINRFVKQPLSQLMTGVEMISQGDLTHAVDVNSKNEFGQLALAFNNMSSEICKKNNLLQRNSDRLFESNTELKKYQTTLEEMVAQRTDKLIQAQNQLIEAEKMASLGGLVAGVAHEINTPVGVGITAASYVSDHTKKIETRFNNDEMTRTDLQEYLIGNSKMSSMILSNLQRAAELVSSFKQVAVDQTTEEKRKFSIVNYINEVLTTLQPRLRKEFHEITVTGDSAIEVHSYPGSFSQIITNLVINSLIHAYKKNDKGQITIDICRNESYISIVYTDDGNGVNEEGLSKIFDPFYTTKRGSGGTGLGMHIVYNIITLQLAGTIKCESQINQGISFTITIPDLEGAL